MSRRVVVALGLAGVLACAGAAEAEGAWVLWGFATGQAYENNATTGKADVTTVHRLPDPWIEAAFPTYQECQRKASTPTDTALHSVHSFMYGQRQVWIASRYTCLPDTVDPRAPKAR